MEHIKEALQRARREKKELSGTEPGGSTARVSRLGGTRIEYKQSRVIQIGRRCILKNRLVALNHEHRAAGAYKVLRTQVLRRMQMHRWSTLAITSPAPAEGKSLTAVNLAISLAQEFTRTVLLVDLDLRRPSISKFFNYNPPNGLTDHLLKGVPLEDVLFNPGIEHLVVLPAGVSQDNASELSRSPEMHDLVEELKARYPERLILFDLPPMLVGDVALSFLPCIDCALLVIEDGKTHPAELTRAVELLGETPLVGTVLNKCKHEQSNHYYQYY